MSSTNPRPEIENRIILTFLLYILIVTIPIITIPCVFLDYNVPKYTVACLGSLFLFLFTLKRKFRQPAFLFPGLLFLFIRFFSTLLSINPYEGIDDIFLFLCFLIIYYSIYQFPAHYQWTFRVVLIAAIAVAGFACVQLFKTGFIQQDSRYENENWLISFLGNRNFMAEFLALTAGVIISGARSEQGVIRKLPYGIWLFASAFLIGAAKARGAMAGLLFGLTSMILFNLKIFKKNRKYLYLTSASIVVIAVGIIIFSVTNQKKMLSANQRIVLWKNMSAMALKKPILGLGADNIKIYYPRYSNAVVKDPEYHMWAEASDAHNIVLQVLLESGIPGFIAFLYFWIKIIVFICKINPSDDIHSSGLQFSLITIIGIACFSPFIDNPVSGTFFFIFLAMLERKIKYVKESKID